MFARSEEILKTKVEVPMESLNTKGKGRVFKSTSGPRERSGIKTVAGTNIISYLFCFKYV